MRMNLLYTIHCGAILKKGERWCRLCFTSRVRAHQRINTSTHMLGPCTCTSTHMFGPCTCTLTHQHINTYAWARHPLYTHTHTHTERERKRITYTHTRIKPHTHHKSESERERERDRERKRKRERTRDEPRDTHNTHAHARECTHGQHAHLPKSPAVTPNCVWCGVVWCVACS